MFVDPTGDIAETVIDVISIGWSLKDFMKAPSFVTAGYLLWDIGAAFIPFAPGSYLSKGGKIFARVASRTDDLKDSRSLILGTYKGLTKAFKGKKEFKFIIWSKRE